MQITFYDKNMIETATADNQLLNAIKIKKASLSSYFEEATHYVEFEFSKETGEWWGIKENGYLAFRFRGKFYRFNIVKFKEDVKTNSISILGDYFNLEMLNENCLAYEKQPSRTIVQHLVAMEILPYANFEIGVNELASSSRVVEYTGEEMKYKRLISLINNFDGECQFEIRQKRNGEFDKLILNIYKANDGEKIQGVGRNRRDLELNIDNTNNISRSVDSTTIRTAIEPTGKDGLRLGNSGKTWRNNDGRVEFEQKDGRIYAVIAAEETTRVLSNDKWLVWKQNFDTDSLDKLESESYKWIKNNCYAKETIEVAGSFDVEIGDTVILNHKGVGRYGLLGTLRVVKIVWDLLTEENEVSFANFKRLSSKISAQGLALQESIETPASYDITFNTTAGQVFKNNTGASIVSFNFKKNGLDVAVIGQRWYNGTQLLSNGLEVTIKPDMLTDGKLNLRLEVDVTDAITFSKELTFINVNDGLNGSKGADGNGIASTVVAYQAGTSATVAPTGTWSSSPVSVPAGQYLWTRTIFTYTDTTTKTIYNVSRQGADGANGKDGQNGQIPHIAYADKSTDVLVDAMPTFSVPSAYGGAVLTSTKIPGGYKMTSTGGTAQIKQLVGFNGTTGKNCYTYLKIKNTHPTNDILLSFNGIGATLNANFTSVIVKAGQTYVDFRQAVCRDTYSFIQINIGAYITANDISYEVYDFAIFNTIPFINFSIDTNTNASYIGMYQDTNLVGSTDPTKYNWSLMRGLDGKDGIPGTPGADGKTPYWHTAWANSADGKTDFSLTDSKGKQFRGEYIDYIQADSTDPTKYNWIDRTSNVKVGGRNYLTKSNLIKDSGTNKLNALSIYDAETPNGFKVTGNDTKNGTVRLYNVINSDGWWTVSFDVKGSQSIAVDVTVDICDQGSTKIWTNTTNTYERKSVSVNVTNYSKNPSTYHFVDFSNFAFAYFWIDNIQIEKGNVATDYEQSPEDIDAKIDSNQALTQEQLNALSEQASIAKAELQAKASIDTLNQWITSYQNYVASNNADSQQAKADLIAWSQKVEALGTQMGEVKETKIFMDRYFSQSSEGLIIGQTDGTSNILIKEDRISMFSAGNEVMYISQGVLNINNGIFALSIQLGRFREEQYAGNKDINVIRYVGGV